MPNTPATRFLAAHQKLAAHGVRLDGHDLTLEQMEAMVAIADAKPSAASQKMTVQAAA